MAKQTINISVPNDHAGDPLRDSFDKCNDNFTELYAFLINKYTDTFNILLGDTQKITTATTHPYCLIIKDSSGVRIDQSLIVEFEFTGGFWAINITSAEALNNCQIFMLW